MSRTRTPRTAGSKYITPEGLERLHAEFRELWHVRRPEVVAALAAAAAEGDRSENAEYIYRKKQLREMDSRIRHLSQRLEQVTVVDPEPADPSRIYFGAWVELEDDDGGTFTYRIVGPDEFDPSKGWISIDSPMARALLGKAEGDEVTVQRPKGAGFFTILGIRYTPQDA